MLTGTSYDDIINMIDAFLEKEDNKVTTFYVMFYMFPNCYRIEYDEEEKDYTVYLDDKDLYDQMMSKTNNDEDFIATMEKATIKIDNLNVYLAFNHIKDSRVVDSITEIDDLRSHYTAMMDEIVLESYDEDTGDELIFSKLIFGDDDSLDEDNESKYVISHYTYQHKNVVDDEMRALPSIETITFENAENVDLMIEELVSLGFGSTYSILESIATRPQFVQASQESINDELVIDSEYVANEVGEDVDDVVDDNTDTEVSTLSSIEETPIEYNSDGIAVFGAKKKTTKKKKNVKTLKITTTNINRAFKQIKKQLNLSSADYDKLIGNIPTSSIKAVYSYDGIQKLCKKRGQTYHMICLSTCNCYEIKKNNKSYTVTPRGRSDKTIHDWFVTYRNVIILYNATIANSFARVKEKISVTELNDIDETIYKSWQQLEAFTLNFLIKGEIKPITLVGSTIQSLYESVITDSKNNKEYPSMILEETGILGWDGSDIYYTETNKTARYKMDKDKIMTGLEKLLLRYDLLGKLDSWTTKKREEKEKAKIQKLEKQALKAAKGKKTKKASAIFTGVASGNIIGNSVTTAEINKD